MGHCEDSFTSHGWKLIYNHFFQLSNLPSSVAEVKETKLTENKEELKIAWRYENLSVEDSQEKTGKIFDLSVPYVIPESQKANIVVWNGDDLPGEEEPKGLSFDHF